MGLSFPMQPQTAQKSPTRITSQWASGAPYWIRTSGLALRSPDSSGFFETKNVQKVPELLDFFLDPLFVFVQTRPAKDRRFQRLLLA